VAVARKREESGMNIPSHQRLARDEDHVWFDPETRESTGREGIF
jgi:hypothetical protein